jgi:hypothetical protein
MTGEFVCLFMSINYIVIYTFEWLILWYCIIAWSVNFLWIHAEWSVHAYAESWPRKKSSYPEIILCWNNLHEEIKDKIIHNSRKDVKSLTEAYTRNISVVAILMASITFAAAFTVSGWYRRSQEIPITAKKYAYQAFLISDTLAACSSLCVAFICIIARWEDFEFLLYYRNSTQKLTWFAYMATTIAFATGLYTILAPRPLWFMSIATMLLGLCPVLKLLFPLRGTFKSDLLSLVWCHRNGLLVLVIYSLRIVWCSAVARLLFCL